MSEDSCVSKDAPAAALIYLYSFTGLMLRDFRALRREFVAFLIRTVMNPLLFVFTCLFPKIGQEVKGSQGVSFGTILLPGLIAVGIFFQALWQSRSRSRRSWGRPAKSTTA